MHSDLKLKLREELEEKLSKERSAEEWKKLMITFHVLDSKKKEALTKGSLQIHPIMHNLHKNKFTYINYRTIYSYV